jgi:hypothetical protein
VRRIDPELQALRARLNATVADGQTLAGEDLYRLIVSWELMRRALTDAPPPPMAVEVHELPHTAWYRRDRRAALDAAIDGTTLADLDAVPELPDDNAHARADRERESSLQAARELVGDDEPRRGAAAARRRAWRA